MHIFVGGMIADQHTWFCTMKFSYYRDRLSWNPLNEWIIFARTTLVISSSATQPFHVGDKPTLGQYRPRLRLKLLSPMLFRINPRCRVVSIVRPCNSGFVQRINRYMIVRTRADITFSNVPIFLTSVSYRREPVPEIQSSVYSIAIPRD